MLLLLLLLQLQQQQQLQQLLTLPLLLPLRPSLNEQSIRKELAKPTHGKLHADPLS